MDTLYDTNYRYIFFPKEIATIIKSNSYLINNLYMYVLVRSLYYFSNHDTNKIIFISARNVESLFSSFHSSNLTSKFKMVGNNYHLVSPPISSNFSFNCTNHFYAV